MPLLSRIIQSTEFWQENKLILREAKHFYKIVLLAILFPILAALFEGFGVGFLLGFLQNLISPDAEPFQTGLQLFDIFILGINRPDLERLYRVSALILGSSWLKSLCNYGAAIATSTAQVRLIDRLNRQVFEQLQGLSLRFFTDTRSGELVNTLSAELFYLQQAIGSISVIFSKGATLVIYTAIAFWISWPLCLIAAALFSLAAIGLSALRKRVRKASFPASQSRAEFMALATEFINGIRTVKAFSTEGYERHRYYRASEKIVTAVSTSARRLALIVPLTEAIATTILIAIVIISMALFVARGTLQTASLLTFLFILFRLIPSIQAINGCFAQLSSYQGSIASVNALLRQDDKPYIINGAQKLDRFKKAIEFISVDFAYDTGNPVLQNVTLSIEKGKTVALVGASGAGKSTLADLVPRFYDPTQGQILIDGLNLKAYEIKSLRDRMAIVSQETFIFNASVRDNIVYGSHGRATEAAVLEAARQANALDFIREMPDGFDTVLGDRGVRLSGGQRQRIAIARALLRNPEILILDEATSALDSVSEKLIQDSIEQLSTGRTVIAIAHRLSTISNADKVVVMAEGRIVEQGGYQELLATKGELWKYHQLQH